MTSADTSKFWLIATSSLSKHICKDMLEDVEGFQLELDMEKLCIKKIN